MAKHTRGGRKGRSGYRYLPVDEILTVGNLTTKDVIANDYSATVDADTYMMSAKLMWGLEGATVGDGPMVVGLAHNSYTAAQIEEAIEASASWDQGDKIANEHRRRLIRTVGIFPLVAADEVLNDGRPIRTKLGFVCQIGTTLKTWAYNPSTGTIATGIVINATGGVNSRRM